MSAEPSTRVFQRRNKPRHKQIAINRRFWRKPNLIYPVKDNTTIKRSIHSILHAERGARILQLQNKPRRTQIAIRRFWRKLNVIYLVKDNSTFKRSFHSILHAKRSARFFQRRKEPRNSKIAVTSWFWRKLNVISFPFLIFRRWNAIFTALLVQNVGHAASSVETRPETRKSQSFVDFDED